MEKWKKIYIYILYLRCGRNYGGHHLGLYRTVHQVQSGAVIHPQRTQNISENYCIKEVRNVYLLESVSIILFSFCYSSWKHDNYLDRNVAEAEAVRIRTPTTTNAMLIAANFRLFSSLISSANTKNNIIIHFYFFEVEDH